MSMHSRYLVVALLHFPPTSAPSSPPRPPSHQRAAAAPTPLPPARRRRPDPSPTSVLPLSPHPLPPVRRRRPAPSHQRATAAPTVLPRARRCCLLPCIGRLLSLAPSSYLPLCRPLVSLQVGVGFGPAAPATTTSSSLHPPFAKIPFSVPAPSVQCDLSRCSCISSSVAPPPPSSTLSDAPRHLSTLSQWVVRHGCVQRSNTTVGGRSMSQCLLPSHREVRPARNLSSPSPDGEDFHALCSNCHFIFN